ncbi:uncharacterized protein si:ch211-163c2.2 [Danio aesculapii]|uniref:uncharacterized protein si:ch211-163c2.2 n=1 Tax=Danio aesculapii TaxID=1142201 RepID=UPI0024BF7D3E|nr:uncharacterized protein si:ch211-163c2.2 [Danio aesculapii]
MFRRVTLTCDIQGENWKYIFSCGDKEYKSEEKEFRITVESTQRCRCFGRRRSGTSRWSNEVTLTVSVLSALKLLSFLLAAFPYLLVSILLGVKCRAHAQANEVDQHVVTEE